MPPKTKYRKYAAKKRAGARRKSDTKPSKTFVKQVQSIISKNNEDKSVFLAGPVTQYNSGISVASDINFLLPDVSQGTGENNRIGDQIRAKKLIIDGLINMNMAYGASSSSTRLAVRVFIVQPKLFTDRATISANFSSWLPYLLRKGGSGVPFAGEVADLFAPVNTELITCYYDKIHFMTVPYMLTQAGQQETAYSYRHFRKELKIKNKKLMYDSGYSSNNQPSNYSPVILIGYAHVDGTAADVVNTQISLSWTSLLDYEDA